MFPTRRKPRRSGAPRSSALTLRGRMLAVLSSAALCGSWTTGDPNASLAAALLIAPLLVDRLWRGRGLPALEVSVGPRRTQAGAAFLETVRLCNTSRRGAVYDLRVVEPRTATRSGGAFVGVLEPGQTVTLQLPARLLRRGRHAQRTYVCETHFPLGLLRTLAVLPCPTDLIAEPARVDLPAGLLHDLGEASAESSAQARGGQSDFWAMREYRFGDDARRVHALRSAASATLVRTETRGEADRDLCLVVDLRRPPGHGVRRTGGHFEWSLGAAATLIERFGREAPLLCFVLGATSRRFELGSAAAADDLMTVLAEARPQHHHALGAGVATELRQYHTCLWVPAGGFSAGDERAALRAMLVTREPAR